MNDKQKDVILRLYAEAVEYYPYQDGRDDKIIELWNFFSCDISDWQQQFRQILEKRRFATALETFDKLISTDKLINEPLPSPSQRVVRITWAPYYKPIAEVAEDQRIFENRRFNYIMTMTHLDMMYRRGILDKDEYDLCHDKIAEKYGFKDDSIFRWEGAPYRKEKTEPPTKKHRRNRTYTKRNKEYWSEFDKEESKD
ncbi:MAG: hypothetical protein J1E81_01510 [Eubacterium sp.]|nr:hypothetical protein [Eubacterium sp.]